MARRLPVYLALDTSGAMIGEPIDALKTGIQTLVSALRQDPYALETLYMSVITFDSEARQIMPLTDISEFDMPFFHAGGTRSMGERTLLCCGKMA